MLKLVTLLALVAISTAAHVPSCQVEKENFRKIGQNAIQLAARINQANLSEEQLRILFPHAKRTDCSIGDGLACVAEIGGTVLECVAGGWTGVGLAGCVLGVIGAANGCADCVCFVIEHLGFSC